MNRPFYIKKYCIIYLISFLAPSALCQTEKQLVPSDLKQQTIVTEPVTLRKGFLRAGILLNYRVADKYFSDSGRKEYYVTSTWGSKAAYDITLQYGLSDRFQIDLVSEYMSARQESQSTEVVAGTNTTQVVVAKQKGFGIGDSHISFKYQLIPEAKNKVSLTGSLNTTVPTGKKNPSNIKSANVYDLPVGDGTYAVGFELFARSIIYPYSFTGYVGYTNNFSGTKIINAGDAAPRKFRFGNRFKSGLSANLHLNEWIVLANELNYYHEGNGKIDNLVSSRMPDSWAASYEPNLVFQVKRFRLGESVKIPIKGKNVPADPLYVMMVQYIF
jgi:hypothetical protein